MQLTHYQHITAVFRISYLEIQKVISPQNVLIGGCPLYPFLRKRK